MRQATNGDIDKAMELLANLPRSRLYSQADIPTVIQNLRAASEEGLCCVFNGYMYLLGIGSQWHSAKRYLYEEFIIRLDGKDDSPPPEQAVAFLITLAKAHDCQFVVASDFLSGALDDAYRANGFIPMGTTFIKEID